MLLMIVVFLIRNFFVIVLAVLFLLGGPGHTTWAKETLAGPVPAVVERVIDGDTLAVVANIWLGQSIRIVVRIDGVDAPEMRGKCESERDLALAATNYLKPLEGERVLLTQIANGKFAGRVLARVSHAETGDLSDALVAAGMARIYSGGVRTSWCEAVIATGAAIPVQ